MPHIIIEYAKDIEQSLSVSDMISIAHAAAVQSELFDSADIKTRAVAFENYRVGDSDHAFLHITAKILSGRTDEQKRLLADLLTSGFSKQAKLAATITAEVIDIDRASYSKVQLSLT